MTVTISISDSPDDIWMAQNVVFCEFANLVIDQFLDDKEIISQVELAEAMNGISLDDLYEENPKLAIRLRRAFQTVAKDVGQGRNWASDKSKIDIQILFVNLVKLLEKFHPEAQ